MVCIVNAHALSGACCQEMFEESDNSRQNSPKKNDGGQPPHAHRDAKSSAGTDASEGGLVRQQIMCKRMPTNI